MDSTSTQTFGLGRWRELLNIKPSNRYQSQSATSTKESPALSFYPESHSKSNHVPGNDDKSVWDFENDLEWPEAHQQDSLTLYSRGCCYYSGNRMPKDLFKAARYYRLAADKGNSDAQYNLALCYYSGEEVDTDFTMVFTCFQQSALQGHIAAQYNLGWCYLNGIGTNRDNTEAIKWFRLAADQGSIDAQDQLNELL
ncbi:hypothetical protein HDU79_006381 [Rhizoclosmatium sp. JEL0117]|nr:hypothetical protein HDU79_006381 [Rhizoclosmatium sp. JEL0117]